jgi:hypothetical protein
VRLIWDPDHHHFVLPEDYWAERAARSQRSGLPSPQLIRDGMESTLNHADGQRYTSKRAYEKAVRAAGCEIVGNDPSFKRPKAKEYHAEGLKDDLKRAWSEHA